MFGEIKRSAGRENQMQNSNKNRWSNLKVKFMLSMLVVGVLPLIVGLFISYKQSSRSLEEVIGSNFQALASETANKIDLVIEDEIGRNSTLIKSPLVIEAVEKQNAFLDQMDDPRRAEWLSQAVQQWKDHGTPPPALYFDKLYLFLQGSLKEQGRSFDSTDAAFITDKNGVLVASINTYPDFTSPKESDWDSLVSKGEVYLSDIYSDAKGIIYALRIVVPVLNAEKQVIGAFHRVYSIKKFLAPAVETIRFGMTGHVMLVNSSGVVVDCPILPTGYKLPDEKLVKAIALPGSGWAQTMSDGHGNNDRSIIGYSPLDGTSAILSRSAGVQWHSFAWQASDELFLPTRNLLFWSVCAGIFSLFLIGVIGTYSAKIIVNPIKKLKAAADQLRHGNQVEHITINSRDEIGDLADSFNKMSQNLSASRVSDERHLSQLQQAITHLSASETRIRAIVNNIADAIITIDERGIVESFNPAAERVFGISASEIAGKNVAMLMPEPDASQHDSYIKRYLETGEARVIGITRELSARRNDGAVFPIQLAISEMFLENQRFFIGIVKDISERKLLDEQIRKLSRAVDQSPSSVLITDKEGKIEYVNPIFMESSGYSLEECIGQTPRILKSGFHPPKFYEKLWELILSGKEWRGEFCNKKKNGDLYWELQSISGLRNAKGEITHFVAVKIDDTERKRAEQQLKLYASELERSNAALKDFASIASHDLQEPLRKIITFGDRLREFSPNMGPQALNYLERMQKSTQRMQQFITDLLEFSQIASKPKQLESVNLNEIVSETLDDLETCIQQTKGSIITGNLPTLEADKLQMRQLFQNLIGNALKFHRENEVPRVLINSRLSIKGFWEIKVQDNGIGFEMKYLDRILKPFQRLHTRGSYEGSGMGLAICKKIVENHGGKLTAKSALGSGATFIIVLPEKAWKE